MAGLVPVTVPFIISGAFMKYYMKHSRAHFIVQQQKKLQLLPCLISSNENDEKLIPMIQLRSHQAVNDAVKNVFIVIMLLLCWLISPLVFAGLEPELVNAEREHASNDASYSSLWLKSIDGTEKHDAITLATHVVMSISGPILRAKVRQTFRNPSQFWSEGMYTFPLPEEAVVDRLRMVVGERVIEGQIHEKQAAKKIYQKAREAGKKTSLLNHHRTNIFTTSVANVGPGETIVVEFEYQQVLDFKAKRFALRFPMVNTPKFTPPRTRLDSIFVEPINAIRNKHDEPGNPVTIEVDLKAGFPIEVLASSSHAFKTQKLTEEHYKISVEGVAQFSNRDFILSWGLKATDKPMVSVLREDVNGESYGLLMVMPPQPFERDYVTEYDQEYGKEYGKNISMPRELVFVLDVSGSMQGESIEQARASVLKALSQLKPEDRFNIVWFNTRAWKLYSSSQSASAENLNFARRKILNENANGGTDMRPALRMALRGEYDPELLRQVIFITDGAVSNEAELFSEIRDNLGRSRLFTVGIGSAPNGYFMRKAARAGRGTFTYVSKPDEVNQKISYLLRQLASPALTDLKLDLSDLSASVLPHGLLPDLYLGEPVYVAFKADKFPEIAVLTGSLGGVPSQLNVPLNQSVQHEGIAVEWGRRKISTLQTIHDQYGKYGAHEKVKVNEHHETQSHEDYKQTLKNEIVELAVAYHQVSKFTSLVAVEVRPDVEKEEAYNFLDNRAGGLLKTNRIPANRPKGWVGQSKVQKQGIRLAQTATDGKYRLLIGFELLLVALLFGFGIRRLQRRAACLRA
ncbi:MAG: Ca-activated chloride channel family protein [Oleiphilaceae bacterium]